MILEYSGCLLYYIKKYYWLLGCYSVYILVDIHIHLIELAVICICWNEDTVWKNVATHDHCLNIKKWRLEILLFLWPQYKKVKIRNPSFSMTTFINWVIYFQPAFCGSLNSAFVHHNFSYSFLRRGQFGPGVNSSELGEFSFMNPVFFPNLALRNYFHQMYNIF